MNKYETPIFTLLDGEIIDFSESHHSSSGCDTCDYGSSYVQDFTVITSKGNMEFNFDNMYEYKISHDYLIKLFLRNSDEIKQKTIKEFYHWLVEQFNNADKHSCVKLNFKHSCDKSIES